MSQSSKPIEIPTREPSDSKPEHSPASSSPEGSPSSSPGSKRKRRQDEQDDEDSKDQGSPPTKKRKTPPIEPNSPHRDSETPRVGQLEKSVEKMKVNRSSVGSFEVDPLKLLSRTPPEDAAELEPDKDKDAADQPPTTPPKNELNKSDTLVVDNNAHDGDTDGEEAAEPVDSEMAVAARRRINGLKRIPHLDRPIEIDPQEYNRKRKASEKLAGSPFSSPAAKRPKEGDESRLRSIIMEEKNEPAPNVPSTPQVPASSGLKGFSAFASAASPFATVSRSENAPFGGGTKPSTIFGGGAAAPQFKSPFPSFSPFTTPKSPGTPSVFQQKNGNSDPAQDLAKETSSTPFPSVTSTPVFGTSSTVGSTVPKSVFGRPSAFGAPPSSPSPPSSAGPTRRAKSPRPSAFGAYATTAGRFAAPSGKIRAKNKAEEEGEGKESDGGTSTEETGEKPSPKSKTFSEMLASKGSDHDESGDEKMVYTEKDTITGEEDEMSVFHGRGKLYHSVNGEWKERGPGVFKLNVNKETGLAPRILMRREGALTLMINAKLFQGMKFSAGADPRYVTFAILDEDSKPKSHLLRFHTAKLAQDLLERVRTHIPK